MTTASWSESPQPQGVYSDEGNGESAPELASLSPFGQGTKFRGRKAPTWAGQYPFRRLPVGAGPACWILLGTYSVSYIRSVKLEKLNPSYRDDPAKMTDLVLSVFAIHYPNLADTQALNSLLMGNERRLVLDKANEEAWRLHQKSPDGALGPPRATPPTGSN